MRRPRLRKPVGVLLGAGCESTPDTTTVHELRVVVAGCFVDNPVLVVVQLLAPPQKYLKLLTSLTGHETTYYLAVACSNLCGMVVGTPHKLLPMAALERV